MENLDTTTESQSDITEGILDGYRFRVCETAEDAARALDIRRRVYVDGMGYDVPVPDAYDARSWLLIAEEEATGRAVGTMRLTPRFAGSFELEEYFTLPKAYRSPKCVEINRFAILPECRKGKTFLPIVSLGLFKLATRFLHSMNVHHIVIASKPEKIWTYEWLQFTRTGCTAQYGTLDSIEHELLSLDLRVAHAFAGHPFEKFFAQLDHREVVLPRSLPAIDLGADPADAFRLSA